MPHRRRVRIGYRGSYLNDGQICVYKLLSQQRNLVSEQMKLESTMSIVGFGGTCILHDLIEGIEVVEVSAVNTLPVTSRTHDDKFSSDC
jgi:hypothetical protein